MFSFKKYFQSWAAKRAPRSSRVILRHRTIYVFPSKQGAAFLLVIILIWVLGTNYQNNLILAFSFLLLGLMLVSAIHAFKNMLGLTFSAAAVQYATAGEIAPFDIEIKSQYQSQHCGLLLFVKDIEQVHVDLHSHNLHYHNSHGGQTIQVRLGVQSHKRGWLSLPRIVLKSYFPLGLIRAWAYIDLDHRALIFPQPIECDKPPLGIGQGDEGIFLSQQAGDEWQGFRNYQVGAPASQIAWKQVARGAGMFLKDYRALQSEHYWLDWQQIPVRDIELALSYLSYWVNQFSEQNIEFGLLLPEKTITMSSGDVHKINALTALALLGEVDQ